MKKNVKRKLLEDLLSHLKRLGLHDRDIFICPTCLKEIPIKNLDKISDAHIIPQAAGGDVKTLLCSKCNSSFGAKQDKWFGEFLKVQRSKNSFQLADASKAGYFHIDGIKVNGDWDFSEKDGFRLLAHVDRNSPEVLRALEENERKSPGRFTVKLTIPLTEKRDDVSVGYLTAAYLSWFSTFGYSWVFQDHLNEIRQIIRGELPKEEANNFVVYTEVDFPLWTGLLSFREDVLPAFGFGKGIVVMPPFYNPSASKLPKLKNQNVHSSQIRTLSSDKRNYDYPPILIIAEDKLIVRPEKSWMIKAKPTVMVLPKGEPLRFAHPVTKEEFEASLKKPTTKHLKLLG